MKEAVPGVGWETHFDNLFRDFRYALRNLRKDSRVFLHALPYKNFARSVVVSRQIFARVGAPNAANYFSPAEVRAFREQNHVFEDIILHARFRPTYNDGKSIRYFPFGPMVSANTFDYLGIPPILGRTTQVCRSLRPAPWTSLQEFYRGPQFQLVTLASFAGIGLILVVIGIFSVMAYTVTLRTHEIGIRVALGAQQTNILSLLLFNGFRLVAAGILIGLLAIYALTRFLTSQISGVSAKIHGHLLPSRGLWCR